MVDKGLGYDVFRVMKINAFTPGNKMTMMKIAICCYLEVSSTVELMR